jgi:ribosome assembly protein 4
MGWSNGEVNDALHNILYIILKSFVFSSRFITTLRGHVQSVYQISFSSDSRLLVSGSADSTVKVWNLSKRQLLNDLPGHADEVYAVDWSPDGQKVATGGKDRVLKL